MHWYYYWRKEENKWLKYGEYVRTKQGYIYKALGEQLYLGKNEEVAEFVEDIVNHSKNIIDLIQVGDYVNGKEVIEVRNQNGKIYLMTGYVPQSYIKDEIKSILTKEMYEQNIFKVVE